MGKIPVLLAGKGSFSYHDYDISEKEQGIIELVAEGLSNREIAEKLYLSEVRCAIISAPYWIN